MRVNVFSPVCEGELRASLLCLFVVVVVVLF